MNFKRNLIVILVLVNLLLLFFVLSKHEKFNNQRAALIDPTLKNKFKIESNVLLDPRKKNRRKQNAELFIDGNVNLGSNLQGDLPRICFGSKCYSSKNLKDFLKYNIPYEVFNTDPIERKTPDKLCYDITGEEPNCITGEDLKLLNGQQYIYIAGPKFDDFQSKNMRNQHHIQTNIGPAPHYYYDINNNYYDLLGKKNYDPVEKYDDPHCLPYSWYDLYDTIMQGDYKETGLDRVPSFFNLSVLNDVSDEIKRAVKVENLPNAEYKCSGKSGNKEIGGACGDGILQMVKQPVHKKKGVNYDDDSAMKHNGHQGRCGGDIQQDNQIMNLAAVNLLPKDFDGTYTDPRLGRVNARDRIKYILFPGEPTGLKCTS